MISFDDLVLRQDSPIYQQILRFVQRGLVAGTVQPGDELPSRRMLSALLGVNPNTVQRAYRLLEDQGLIQSRAGSGSCVQADADTIGALRRELLQEDLGGFVAAVKQSRASLAEAQALLQTLWEEQP